MWIYVGLSLFIILLGGFLLGGLLGAPWVPAYKRDVKTIISDAQLRKGQIYIELGCGDGRLVAAAAQLGAKSIGYEINPLMWFIAWLRNLKYSNAKIRLANFWDKDLSGADVVFAFLMPKFMVRLEQKTNKEMKKNSKLISYVFKLPSKKPTINKKRWFIYRF